MNKMILLDLETQKFQVESGIYEVSCLVIENYTIVDRLYLGEKIEGYKGKTTYGYGFHNISKNAKYISKFKSFLSKYNYPIVAHNCSFDRKFLLYYDWIEEDYPCYCSIQAIKKEIVGLKSYSLENLVKHFKIENKPNHTAMSDTESLYKLLCKIKPSVWKKMRKSSINNKEKINNYTIDNEKSYYFDKKEEKEDFDYDELKDYFKKKKWFVYLMLFIFFPYGLWIMWKNNDISLKIKLLISIFFVFLGIIANNS